MSARWHGEAARYRRGDELLAPYRTLALRVISLAVRDLTEPGQGASSRETARAFFSGSRMLNHWCELAELDPRAIRDRLQHVLRGVPYPPVSPSSRR